MSLCPHCFTAAASENWDKHRKHTGGQTRRKQTESVQPWSWRVALCVFLLLPRSRSSSWWLEMPGSSPRSPWILSSPPSCPWIPRQPCGIGTPSCSAAWVWSSRQRSATTWLKGWEAARGSPTEESGSSLSLCPWFLTRFPNRWVKSVYTAVKPQSILCVKRDICVLLKERKFLKYFFKLLICVPCPTIFF